MGLVERQKIVSRPNLLVESGKSSHSKRKKIFEKKFCLKTDFFRAWKVQPDFGQKSPFLPILAIFARNGQFGGSQRVPFWCIKCETANKRLFKYYTLRQYILLWGYNAHQQPWSTAKLIKNFRFWLFRVNPYQNHPEAEIWVKNAFFWPIGAFFSKMRLWKSKWSNTNVMYPHLHRLNLPNLKGIRKKAIWGDFRSGQKFQVPKMALLRHSFKNPYQNGKFFKFYKIFLFSKKNP